MKLITEALSRAKRRREYCEQMLEKTKRKIWKDELNAINYTISFLREEIRVKTKPLAKAETTDGLVRPDLLLRRTRRSMGD